MDDQNKTQPETTPEVTPIVPTPEVVPAAADEVTSKTPVSDSAPQEVTVVVPVVTTESVVDTTSSREMPVNERINVKLYVGVVIVILAIAAVLVFALEKQGRINTGIFTSIITSIEANDAVATVNDAPIIKREYENGLKQLTDYVTAQGGDINDPAVTAEIKSQAIETLINAEVLRQAALAAGFSVTPEQVTERLTEIETSIGGAETLKARMLEIGVSEGELKEDIENELLIQQLFDSKIVAEVSDEEVEVVYKEYATQDTGLGEAELRSALREQLVEQKKVSLINDYIAELREAATIEIFVE